MAFNTDNPIIQGDMQGFSINNRNLMNSEPLQGEQDSIESEKKSKKSNFPNEGSIRLVRFRRRRKVKKQKNAISHNSSLRNDTKNIPKNYGKAMLAYIEKNTRQAK